MKTEITSLTITSSAFGNEGYIPSKYTCQGENINPPIYLSGFPKETKSLALIMEDPDASRGTFDHWLLWNIRPSKQIAENSTPGIQGKNSFGETKYGGPCPPSGTHRYYFKVFALDEDIKLKTGDKKDLLKEMEGHILATGEIMGRYKKS